jgi:hypothetical protein
LREPVRLLPKIDDVLRCRRPLLGRQCGRQRSGDDEPRQEQEASEPSPTALGRCTSSACAYASDRYSSRAHAQMITQAERAGANVDCRGATV